MMNSQSTMLRGGHVLVWALLATLFLSPDGVWAQYEACGAHTADGDVITCDPGETVENGIEYPSFTQYGALTLKIPGVSGTTTNIRTSTDGDEYRDSAVVIREWGDITLEIGKAGAVALTQATGRSYPGGIDQTSGNGVHVRQLSAPSGEMPGAVTVDVSSRVTIGTQATRMLNHGIRVNQWGMGTAATSVTSGATVYAETDGIHLSINSMGKVSLTNTGAVTAGKRGIFVGVGGNTAHEDGLTLTNGGTIMSGSDVATEAHGIRVENAGMSGATLDNVGDITTKGTQSHGISYTDWRNPGAGNFMLTNKGFIVAGGSGIHLVHGRSGTSTVDNKGDIRAAGDFGIYLSSVRGSTPTIINEGAITSGGVGIRLTQEGLEAATLTNSGRMTAVSSGLYAVAAPANTGGITLTNSGAISVRGPAAGEKYGIRIWNGGKGETRIVNGGDITVTGPFTPWTVDSTGIRAIDDGTGHTIVENGAHVTADNYGIFVRKEGAGGDIAITHSAGEIFGKGNSGILAWVGRWLDEGSATSPEPVSTALVRVDVTGGSVRTSSPNRPAIEVQNLEGGSAEVNISKGASVTSRNNFSIFAALTDRNNVDGRIRITQAGTISGRGGIYALVERSSAAGEMRAAADQPLIDVAWTGTATPSTERVAVPTNGIAHAIETMQEQQAAAVIPAARAAAGINAEVMSWRTINRIVSAGDDPGEIADVAAQHALLDAASSDAAVRTRAEAILGAFRGVLENRQLGTIPGADAIDTDGTTGYSDDELKAYLTEDSDDRRAILRSILTRHLSEGEAAVLRALIAGTDLSVPLNALPSVYDDAWKSRVRDLENNYNVGNIRVAMTGGSIRSDGDGIRAVFSRQHNGNGSIIVTVAEDASVTGDVAGIYVGGAGLGADGILKQTVTVHGTVTGGTDAAVHLASGGRLTIGSTGEVLAGSSGRAILVNDPGDAVIVNQGMVRGGEEGYAVELTGGGRVENSGTIAGKMGIRAGAGSTVVNTGTVRSTDGTDGVAIDFPEGGANTLTLRRGNVIVGRIRGLGGPEDTVDLSDLDPAEVGTLTFEDETGTPMPLNLDRIRQPRGVGRLVPVGSSLVEVPTIFALADEVLSDLTGSIHAAVAASGGPGPESRATGGHVFATPFGGMRDQDGDDGLADATHAYGGGLIGADAGGDGAALHVGGFVGGSAGRVAVDNRQDVDMQTFFAGAYARQTRGDVRLDARLLLGHISHDSTRRLGRRVAEAKYTSTFISPEVGVATTLQLMSRLTGTPRLRVRYAGLYTGGFREQTAGLDLQVAGRDVHLLEGRGEMGVPIPLGDGGRLEPRVGAELRWLMSGEMVQLTAPGGSRRVSAGGDQVVGTGTVGVEMALPVAEAMALVGNFDGAYTTERAWRATGYLGLTYSF